MNINSKEQFYKIYRSGKLGNKLKTWYSFDDLIKDNFQGTVGIRVSNYLGGGQCFYGVAVKDVPNKLKELPSQVKYVLSESAPDENIIFQGEITNSTDYITLFYSTVKDRMRVALQNAQHAYGVQALNILKRYMTATSYDDLMMLLDEYPNSVVEFGVYQNNLGECPHRNMIIWEVRCY
jgi:hypothetical protein